MDLNVNDQTTTVTFFKEKVKEFVEKRKWVKYHTPKNLIQALGIEVAELSELFLFKNYTIHNILKNKTLLNDVSEEIADVLIYLISLVNSLNIDLTQSFCKKMEKNKLKYPIRDFNNGEYYKR